MEEVDRPPGDTAREYLGCLNFSDYDDVPGFIIALLKQPAKALLLHCSLSEAEVKFGD